jgi:hypothetical protein
MFVQLSEILRLEGFSVGKDLEARIPLLEQQFNLNGNALRELLALKTYPEHRRKDSDEHWYEQVFPVLDSALAWLDNHWRDNDLP